MDTDADTDTGLVAILTRARPATHSRRGVWTAALGGLSAILIAAMEADAETIRIKDKDKHRKRNNSQSNANENDQDSSPDASSGN